MFRTAGLRRLIDTHGVEATFKVVSEGAYDPATGTTTNSSTSYTVKCYPYDYDIGDLDNDNIRFGDRRILLSTLDVDGDAIPEPVSGDEIVGIGDTVTVVSTRTIYSVNPMCYICQVRE